MGGSIKLEYLVRLENWLCRAILPTQERSATDVAHRISIAALKYAINPAKKIITAKCVIPTNGELKLGISCRRKLTRKNTSFTPPPIKI